MKVTAVSFFGVIINEVKKIASTILVENIFDIRVPLKESITFIEEY